MRRLDIGSSIFWLVFSAFVSIHSLSLGLGNLREPGPGFLFFWCGVVMAILSVGVLVPALIRRASKGGHEDVFGNVNWKKVITVLAAIILYGIAFERLGYLISTFLLVFFLLAAIGAKRWYVVLLVASASSFLSYVLFDLWLQVRLPKGFIGI